MRYRGGGGWHHGWRRPWSPFGGGGVLGGIVGGMIGSEISRAVHSDDDNDAPPKQKEPPSAPKEKESDIKDFETAIKYLSDAPMDATVNLTLAEFRTLVDRKLVIYLPDKTPTALGRKIETSTDK